MPALRTRDIQSRTLEVSTDAPQTPSLNIVSPTPRAFTFPITHNLSDSPYSSPCNSPFEPELRSFPSSQCTTETSQSISVTPPPAMTRTLSPVSPLRHPSPSPVNHKRRKSSCSSDVVERRPKKGDEDYVKRPENAFILFRRQCCEDRQQLQDATAGDGPAKKQRQADLSKTISQQWKGLTNEERKVWEEKAMLKKKEHEKLHPGYVYRPQRAKDKDGRTKNNKKPKKLDYDEADSVSFTIPIVRPHGRSASAPTPPPYQSIQIPNVYQMTPSCPTSPSLLPMISRRSAHPGHPEEAMNFDFMPNASYVPPSYAMQGQFEANLQSSEFLRSMWNTAAPRPHSPLRQLSMSTPDALLLPAHHIVSPSHSGSGSSGPSSPSNGPYTPTFLSQNYSNLAPDASLEAQAQAEMDLQMEMQMQQEFANFAWGGNGSLWSSEPAVLLDGDFDINAIPPLELGMPKYTENMAMSGPHATGLEFGQDFVHALEERHYHGDSQNLGLLGFDEMMAGHSF